MSRRLALYYSEVQAEGPSGFLYVASCWLGKGSIQVACKQGPPVTPVTDRQPLRWRVVKIASSEIRLWTI